MKEKYYITTAIAYTSAKPHIGNTYEIVLADLLARFKRKQGYDVRLQTGTDEHGEKIQQKAEAAGVSPKEYVDKTAAEIKRIWDLMNSSYDKFIRTTDEYHEKQVQEIFERLLKQGDIYKGEYKGWYCTPCESFWTESQLVDGKCPDCGREVELTKEESYFFRLSKYQDRLIDLIENHPDFLLPKSRQNEMLNNFLRPGLQDLCVSRSSFRWGIPVPFDPQHVVYVWIDALTNYITALGYGSEDDSLFRKYWPADLHMMGKEIVRFHSIIWPALLMALDIPLPKEVYGHGWLLLGSEKISKSKGNIVDPFELSARYSVDAVRYFLLREVPFGSDGMYTNRAFLTRINTDLCNSLGNLLSRTTAMVNQYFGGVLPAPDVKEAVDDELTSMIDGLFDRVRDNMDKLLVPEALHEIWTVIGRANKYIDETTPWILAKDPAKQGRLATVLYNLSEALRVSAVLLSAFLIETPAKILSCFGLEAPARFGDEVRYGKLKGGETVLKAGKLYERIDIEKELIAMEKRAEELAAESAKKEEQVPETPKKATIQYDDFAKLDLKVGKIVAAEPVKRSEKLLKFTVEIGAERRTIVSGIAKYYKPEETIGKLVSVVTNLAPVKLCGVVSEGMLMCASDADGKVVLLAPEAEVASGSEIS